MRSVIIDDETPNRENLRSLLKRYCPALIVVAEAEDVEVGLKVMNQYQPDLLFLDIQLHGKSGFDLLKSYQASLSRSSLLQLTVIMEYRQLNMLHLIIF